MKHDTLYIGDNTCGLNYVGTYKVEFFKQDSLKFHVIQDTCQGRREGTDNFLFRKLKPPEVPVEVIKNKKTAFLAP